MYRYYGIVRGFTGLGLASTSVDVASNAAGTVAASLYDSSGAGIANPTTTNSRGAVDVYSPRSSLWYKVAGDTVWQPLPRMGGASATSAIDYGAFGDGATDDAATLQAAFTAAAGSECYIPPGIYIVGTQLTVPANTTIRGAGRGLTILKKKATFATPSEALLYIDTSGVTVADLAVDGNRTGGALRHGIMWKGASGHMRDVYIHANYGNGVSVNHADAELDAVRVESSDNVSATNAANGFITVLGRLRTYECEASGNDSIGFYFYNTAGVGCHLDGRADDNYNAGARIDNTDGTIGDFIAVENGRYGVYFGGGTAARWKADHIFADRTGHSTTWGDDVSGTSLQLIGAADCAFGTVVSARSLGYGVALSSYNETVPASHNSFGSILCERGDASDSDPALHISGGSSFNSVGHLHVSGYSHAVRIGEGYAPATNNYNTIDSVHGDGLAYGVVRIDAGNYNHIGTVVSRDCYTAESGTGGAKGIVSFQGAGTTFNTVLFIDHVATGTEPLHVAWADANAVNNYVVNGFAREMTGTAVNDENTGNHMTLAL